MLILNQLKFDMHELNIITKNLFGERYHLEHLDFPGQIDYTLIKDNRRINFDVFLDANQGFALFFENELNAILGLEEVCDKEQREGLNILQIQGLTGSEYKLSGKDKKYYPRGLFKQNWRKNFLEITKSIAKGNYKEFIAITPSDRLLFDVLDGNKKYDDLALSEGFHYDSKLKLFVNYNYLAK